MVVETEKQPAFFLSTRVLKSKPQQFTPHDSCVSRYHMQRRRRRRSAHMNKSLREMKAHNNHFKWRPTIVIFSKYLTKYYLIIVLKKNLCNVGEMFLAKVHCLHYSPWNTPAMNTCDNSGIFRILFFYMLPH